MTSSSTTEFPINAQVILQGLVKAPHLNEKKGVVKSASTNDRQTVYVEELSKSFALKTSNLKYGIRRIDDLSVKDLKTLLVQKSSTTTTELLGLDKNELRAKVESLSYDTEEEIAKILATANAPPKGFVPPVKNHTLPSSQQQHTGTQAADMMSSMDPDQLRQQALMMRSMTPNQIRRTNPQLANMTDAQIQMAISQMEMMANNPSMMKMAAEQMKNMSPEEINKIQQQTASGNGIPPVAHKTSSSLPSSTTTTESNSSSTGSNNMPPSSQADMMANMSPEMMQQQAKMMKSMDPSMIRSMNPAFANMTDEQIKMAANQMEMMASNPSMMKMAAEQMKNMSPEDVKRMQQMAADGGAADASSPAGGAGFAGMDPASMMKNLDPKQMKEMIAMVKQNPEILKSQAKMSGLSEEQISKGLDMFSNMDEKQLNTALGYMVKMGKAKDTVVNTWNKMNKATKGQLLKILIFLFLLLVYLLIQKVVIGGSKNAIDGGVASSTGGDAEDLVNAAARLTQNIVLEKKNDAHNVEEFSEF